MAQAASDSSSRVANEDSLFKKLLSIILDHLLSQRKYHWSKLYRDYVGSFLTFINSRFPYQVSLDLSLLSNMSLTKKDESVIKSFRELMEDSRRNSPAEDVQDTLLRYHSTEQSDISSNMVQMARALKTQSLAANSIIKRDVQGLQKASSSAEQNATALKATSEKLAVCTKDGMNWCLVVLVVVVLMIFVNLIILMKVMKKN